MPQWTEEELKKKLRAEGKVWHEVIDRVMKVIKHGRHTSNPEELWDAIFGHPNVKVVLGDPEKVREQLDKVRELIESERGRQ